MASETIYDHPRYYDILFGFDRSQEVEFYDRTFSRRGVARGERVLELACGPARVARLLARRGYRMTGLDHRPAMLAFARDEAAREAIPLATLCADMTEFASEEKFAAATLGDLVQMIGARHGDRLAAVLRASSFLVDGLAIHDRSMPLPEGASIDVLPPFAGG